MSSNKNLHKAKEEKNDEFYTQLVDIENELKHYRKHFIGKTILCNCDDPYESNFFKFFAINFNFLGIKKLIATCYDGSPFAGTQLSLFDLSAEHETDSKAFKIEISEIPDYNQDGAVDLSDVEHLIKCEKNIFSRLSGNGDFRSSECVELLKESDIVVTNPPFSLFREYIAQLVDFNKKFIIIGNQNSIICKELFPLIQDGKMWFGYSSGDMSFKVPKDYPEMPTRYWVDESGQKWRSMGNVRWYTNLDIDKRHEDLILYKKYSPNDYQQYDGYKAIFIQKYSEIPYDFDGDMGVPITFLDKYNDDQFEIIGLDRYIFGYDKPYDSLFTINGKEKYRRIIIRRRRK
jgi:hypothetical protein